MSTQDIAKLDVGKHLLPGGLLAMWVTNDEKLISSAKVELDFYRPAFSTSNGSPALFTIILCLSLSRPPFASFDWVLPGLYFELVGPRVLCYVVLDQSHLSGRTRFAIGISTQETV